MNPDLPLVESRRVSRREVVAGLLMASAAAVAMARKPNIRMDRLGNHKLDDIVPDRVGRWSLVGNSGLVVPPQDQLQLVLYSQLLTRVYSDGANAIMLLIAYSASESGFLQVHRPEFCYRAAGYELSDFAPRNVQLDGPHALKANTLTATREDSIEQLLYWVRIGDHIPHSWAQQKLAFAGDNLKRLIPDAALVRVSTIGPDKGAAMPLIDDFVRSMVASVPQPLRPVLIA